jgi:hypothetical protein
MKHLLDRVIEIHIVWLLNRKKISPNLQTKQIKTYIATTWLLQARHQEIKIYNQDKYKDTYKVITTNST